MVLPYSRYNDDDRYESLDLERCPECSHFHFEYSAVAFVCRVPRCHCEAGVR